MRKTLLTAHGSCAVLVGLACLASLLALPDSSEAQNLRPGLFCGTTRPTRAAPHLRRFSASDGFAGYDFFALDYAQDPPFLTGAHTGPVHIRDLRIVGDLPELQFWGRDYQDQDGGTRQTWRRTGTQRINGRIVSLFTLSWPAQFIFDRLADKAPLGGRGTGTWDDDYYNNPAYGYDVPTMPLGYVSPSGEEDDLWGLDLRMSPNLPRAPVRRINAQVQYSSHVVNLRVDDFTERNLTEGWLDSDPIPAFGPTAKLFYQHFPDFYDTLAFVAQREAMWVMGGARHFIIQNQVRGIGLGVFDDSRELGSQGRLKGVQFYKGGWLGSNHVSNHELMHQWADYLNMGELSGCDAWDPTHTTTMYPQQNGVGNWWEPWELIKKLGPNNYRGEIDTREQRQHPLHLYLMGLVPPSAVPDMVVFRDQFPFHSMYERLGATARVWTINDVMAEFGARSGPVVPREWRRATIVVSSGGLLTQREMDYWNFYSKRMGERFGTDMFVTGTPSFYESTGRRVRLRTDITPKQPHARIPWAEPTTYRGYSRRDWHGIVLDAVIPGCLRMGQTLMVRGRVLDARADSITISVLHRRAYTGEEPDWWYMVDATLFEGPVSQGRFSVPIRFDRRGDLAIWMGYGYGGGAQFEDGLFERGYALTGGSRVLRSCG